MSNSHNFGSRATRCLAGALSIGAIGALAATSAAQVTLSASESAISLSGNDEAPVQGASSSSLPDGSIGAECDLTLQWFNGDWNGMSAIASDVFTIAPDVTRRTCDDFWVEPCECLQLDDVYADFLVDSVGRNATLTIFDTDCDGCPGNPIIMATATGSEDLGEFQGFEQVRYHFDEFVVLDSYDGFTDGCGFEPTEDEVWLCEGRYWLCVQHVGDGDWQDNGFWCGTDKFQGAEARHFSNNPQMPWPECTPVSEVNQNFGKRDTVFALCGKRSRIFCDNGDHSLNDPAAGFDSELNIALPNNFTADNFQIPCTIVENWEVEYFEVKLAANFIPCKANLEVWSGDCYPESPVSGADYETTLVSKTGERTMNNSLDVYCVQFCDVELDLDSGQNYWIVLNVQQSGFGKIAFWLFNRECDDFGCIKISEGQCFSHPRDEWLPLSDPFCEIGEARDFSFKVCGDRVQATSGDDPPADDDEGDSECERLRKMLERLSRLDG